MNKNIRSNFNEIRREEARQALRDTARFAYLLALHILAVAQIILIIRINLL